MGRGGNNAQQVQFDSEDKKAKKKVNSLIPMGDEYMSKGFNLLLIGRHGTGKTESVSQIADRLGLKIKIFNCSTLDPYTDLIGVPVPSKNEDGQDELKMVRPREVDQAEIIFFDEINRAPQATQNAVFEIIQFQTINGEKLKNLKCCWAAMNPADEGYLVEDVDPALIDRFDAYHAFVPKVSVPYMSKFMNRKTAQALSSWWNDHKKQKRGPESYISPRRLMKLGILYEKMGNTRAVIQALPPGGSYDHHKLALMLTETTNPNKKQSYRDSQPLASKSSSNLDVSSRVKIRKNSKKIISYLEKNPKDFETQRKILQQLETGVGARNMLDPDYFGGVLNQIYPAGLEGFFSRLPYQKKNQLKNELQSRRSNKIQTKYPRLHKIACKQLGVNSFYR
jgi:hypothetical protein